MGLPVAVAYAHRYYRRCGSGISIFYFSICTLCCVNVTYTSYVCHVSYMECYLRPAVIFDLIILLILGILGSDRRLTPVAMVTSDR